MPVVRQTKVSQDERDKYKAATAIGVPLAAASAVGQHHAVHNYGRKLGPGNYTKPKPWQFHQLFDPRKKSGIKTSRKIKGGAGWTAAMVGARLGTPLAAGGLVGLASTKQRPKRDTDRAGFVDRAKAGAANALRSSREEAPPMKRKDSALMGGSTFLGGTIGGGIVAGAADAHMRRKHPARVKALAAGKIVPHKGRALAGTAGAIAGSIGGLKLAGSHIQRKNPDYQMTPFGLRYREHVAVGKAEQRSNTGYYAAGGGTAAVGGGAYALRSQPFKELPGSPQRRAADRRLIAHRPGTTKMVDLEDLALKYRRSGWRIGEDAQVASMAQWMRSGEAKFAPIKLRNVRGDVQVVDGAHRLKAALMAGYTQVPAYMETSGRSRRTPLPRQHRRASLREQARLHGRQTDEQLAAMAAKRPGRVGLWVNRKLGSHAARGLSAVPWGVVKRYEALNKSAIVAVSPVTRSERREEAHRKRTQAALSTGAAVGTLASLGMRGGGAATAKWGAKAFRTSPAKAKRVGDVLSNRAIDVGMGAGSIGAGSSLYFGRQQRREAKMLEGRQPQAKRWTAAEEREVTIAQRAVLAKALWRPPRVQALPTGLRNRAVPFSASTYQRRSPTGRVVTVARRGGIG